MEAPAPPPATPRRRPLRLVGWLVVIAAAPPAVAWVLLVLAYFAPFPAWFRLLLAGGWSLLLVFLAWRHRPLLPPALLGGLAAVAVFRAVQIPVPLAVRAPLHEFRPFATLEGHRLCLQQVRDARHLAPDRAEVRWRRVYLDLDELAEVDLVVAGRPDAGPGRRRAYLSFGLRDGRRVVVGFAAELPPGESYSPLKGCFRGYLLRGVLAGERDLLGRALLLERPLHILPLSTTLTERDRLLRRLLARINGLRVEPRFHHCLYRNADTELARALAAMRRRPAPPRPRLLPATPVEELAHAAGLLEATGALEEILAAHRITAPAGEAPAGERAWSAWIRGEPSR